MVVCLLPRAKRRYELVLMVLQSGTKNSVMMEYLFVYVSQSTHLRPHQTVLF